MIMKRLLAMLLCLMMLATNLAFADVATETDLGESDSIETLPADSGSEDELPTEVPPGDETGETASEDITVPETGAESEEEAVEDTEEEEPVLDDLNYYLIRSVKEAKV